MNGTQVGGGGGGKGGLRARQAEFGIFLEYLLLKIRDVHSYVHTM